MSKIECHRDLNVYQAAFDAAIVIYRLTKRFPAEEKYSMVDQMRRSSRSVCANIAEAWRKRRYAAHFISKLSDAEAEADETRVWLEFALKCGFISASEASELDQIYNTILAQLVNMVSNTEQWVIRA